ncbi:hypothetical protein HAX54_051704 [Datura stramonium]|uniref:Lipid desaturase domain-containing protein n=1 Tax=Datura stramonium TaxID=4076 RepID=A0ABS8SYL1_DATST|nr:hypothetical protein [Datura stramonium]
MTPSLKSTWTHQAWMVSGCSTVLISLARSALWAVDSQTWAGPLKLRGYVLSDLASGIYHWGIDNYGSAETPVFGSQIDAFQGHHKWPWTITRRQFANNLHALARAVTFTVTPNRLLCNDPAILCFVGVFPAALCSASSSFLGSRHENGAFNRLALQDAGILVSRSQHAALHQPRLTTTITALIIPWILWAVARRCVEGSTPFWRSSVACGVYVVSLGFALSESTKASPKSHGANSNRRDNCCPHPGSGDRNRDWKPHKLGICHALAASSAVSKVPSHSLTFCKESLISATLARAVTFTRRQFANNLHALARALTFTVLPIDLLCNDPVILCFVGVFPAALCSASSIPGLTARK